MITDSRGLTSLEAKEKLAQFGPNQIFKPTPVSFWGIFAHEVTEPMILLLLVVGFFYILWGELGDAITIIIVITLLVAAEVFNEFQAKKAITSLGKIAAPKTKVLRDSAIALVDSEEIVPGDLLILTAGTKIAADAKVTKAINLEVDESALTGESLPQEKKINQTISAGTVVSSGEGEALIETTGSRTRLGKIASTLKQIKTPRTPLQLAMRSLSGKLVYFSVLLSTLIVILGIAKGQNIKTMILTGLSLSFATIPEELPIIITMVLGLGSYTLAKNKFFIKKIKAAEVLGQATVIATDKTGTITEGKMKIALTYPANQMAKIIETAVATISDYSTTTLDLEIKNKAKELKIDQSTGEILRQRNFGDGRKTKTVIQKINSIDRLIIIGAPEEIFSACTSIPAEVKKVLTKETSKGRRVIALATKNLSSNQLKTNFVELEKNLELIGLISFEDPARAGVAETIAQAKQAGIRTIMITGDHPQTALFIAHEVGILTDHEALTGEELDHLTDDQLKEIIKKNSVFARTNPDHKYRIVKALQSNGEVVAVTGDGINDALALKSADIGIAMGVRGTDVAKEAAEIVLADDNYITIAQGVFEARKFYDNLEKGVKYYLAVKLGLIMIFLLPALLAIPLPFSPIQIIVLELFMDLAASAGFVAEPREADIYSRPPRNPKEKLFNFYTIKDIVIKGSMLFASVILVYFWARFLNLSLVETQTYSFSAWIFGHIILAFISRSDRRSTVSNQLLTNKIIDLWATGAITLILITIYLPFFGQRLNLTMIKPITLVSILLIVLVVMSLLELRKMFRTKSSPSIAKTITRAI